MKKQPWLSLLFIFIIALLLILGFIYLKPILFNKNSQSPPVKMHADQIESYKRGPHGGRLLENDHFQVEVTLVEQKGIPPTFRIYFYENGNPLNPSKIHYSMELKRINRNEKIPFKQKEDYLESSVIIHEPHSYQVKISAIYKGKDYEWDYESYEGRIKLTPEAIKANHIKIEEAGPVNLEIKLDVMGKIMPNEELTVHISPRFPGVVKAVYKKLGDYVHKGDTLAVIESNESLQNYEVKSEINGMIIKKNINLGMYLSGQESIFVVSDLSNVWADFNIYHQDLAQVQVGDPLEVSSLDKNIRQQAVITYISSIGEESTQSVTARALLTNSKDQWKPGLFISGELTIENIPIPVAVKNEALQTFRNSDVVFIAVEDQFEAVPVELGRRNKDWVEIRSGLQVGDHYVSDNSFVLKADLEKSGAEHEH